MIATAFFEDDHQQVIEAGLAAVDPESEIHQIVSDVLSWYRWIRSQGWKIKDVYKNNRRPGLPANLTITEFAELHFGVAQKVIQENGGRRIKMEGGPGFLIRKEEPANVEKLPQPLHRITELREHWWPVIQREIAGDSLQRARAVHLAVCLDLVREISVERRENWLAALPALNPITNYGSGTNNGRLQPAPISMMWFTT